MPSDEEWAAAEAALSPGTNVGGTVLSHRHFGFFMTLDDHPAVPGLVQIVDYKPEGVQPRYGADGLLDPPYPEVGASIRAEVLWLRENNRQILLRSPA